MQSILLSRSMTGENPYEIGTLSWHLWLDVVETIKALGLPPLAGNTITLSQLAQHNASEVTWYLDHLSELVQDGWIKLLHAN